MKVQYAMTGIKGIGRRFSNVVLKKADVDLRKRYGKKEKISQLNLLFQKKKSEQEN